MWITAPRKLGKEAEESILRHRRGLEKYASLHPQFLTSLSPLAPDPWAPPLVRAMLAAGNAAGTGPMAAVAGAIAQAVGMDLAPLADGEVMVENGGDIYLEATREVTVGLEAGDSPISGRLGISIAPEAMPLCLGTSSGTVGHSLSLAGPTRPRWWPTDAALADACGHRPGQPGQGAAGHWQGALEWVQHRAGGAGGADRGGVQAIWPPGGRWTLVDLERRGPTVMTRIGVYVRHPSPGFRTPAWPSGSRPPEIFAGVDMIHARRGSSPSLSVLDSLFPPRRCIAVAGNMDPPPVRATLPETSGWWSAGGL